MTIHFFTFHNITTPAPRQRTFYVADELNKRGFSAVVHTPYVLAIAQTPWPKKFLLIMEVITSLFSIRKRDIVFLQRTIYSKHFFVIMVVYLFLFRRKMIFDFDDPVYVHNYFKTKTFCRMADAVIVGTHEQLLWAKQFNPNVHVIHMTIDPAPYEKFTKDYSVPVARPVIGWLGTGPEHLANLPILVPVFERLAKQKDTPFTFVLIGAFNDPRVYNLFQHIPGLDVRFIDKLAYIDRESGPKEIQKFDIGVVPHVSKGTWYEGKTSMKVLEYMACAVPAVVSDFGNMHRIITDGVNGYLASTDDEWVEKLSRLLRDRTLSECLGRAGQLTVREGYSFDATMPKVIRVINSV